MSEYFVYDEPRDRFISLVYAATIRPRLDRTLTIQQAERYVSERAGAGLKIVTKEEAEAILLARSL